MGRTWYDGREWCCWGLLAVGVGMGDVDGYGLVVCACPFVGFGEIGLGEWLQSMALGLCTGTTRAFFEVIQLPVFVYEALIPLSCREAFGGQQRASVAKCRTWAANQLSIVHVLLNYGREPYER
jgi:hypothetical protein